VFFEFPTKDEWRQLESSYPFKQLWISEDDFQYTNNPDGSIENFFAGSEIRTWAVHLQNRLIQVRWSYVLSMFHFNKGIPDERWFISPGKKGQSIEYYPNFEEADHFVKAQFDYYVDVFYYKLFSAWDTLGHLLNVTYELEIERADFYKAVRKLKVIRPVLYSKFKKIMDSADFKKMREFRHNITHNHLLGHIGSSVRKVSKNHITFGGGSYTPSAQVKENMAKSLDLLVETLEAIKEQSAAINTT
jgi:Cthe_2314-like HEPN